jgi:hypothetical protein
MWTRADDALRCFRRSPPDAGVPTKNGHVGTPAPPFTRNLFAPSRLERLCLTSTEERALPTIWCETCNQPAPLSEWVRKLYRTRVVVGVAVIGYTSTYEHRVCRAFTAVPVT